MVKTETDVENTLGIKKESLRSDLKSIQNASTDSWTQEKQKLVEQIVALKNENQKTTYELKKVEKNLAVIISEKKT